MAFDLVETRFSAQEAALYACPNDIEDFAYQIEMLLDNEKLRQRMGLAGRRRIEETLSWQHSQRSLLATYEALFTNAVDYLEKEKVALSQSGSSLCSDPGVPHVVLGDDG